MRSCTPYRGQSQGIQGKGDSESIQSETICPTPREILDLDVLVSQSFPLTPQQQPFFRMTPFLVDICDTEPQYETPNHSQDQFSIPIDDIFGTNVGQVNSHLFDPVEGLFRVLHLLDSQDWVLVEPPHADFGQDFLKSKADQFLVTLELLRDRRLTMS